VRLPTFLIIGAMKAGTTALHDYLGRQPGVFVSDPKELDFFRGDGAWHRGLDWYASHFADAGDAVAIGESSPNYTKRHSDPDVVDRIDRTLPDVRFVYLIRHPIERIVSMYRHLAGDGLEPRPFDTAVLDDADYVDTSRYAFQIEPYLERFGPDRVLVMRSEDLRDRRAATVSRALEHIGAPVTGVPYGLDVEPNRTDDRRVAGRWGRLLLGSARVRGVLDRSWRLRRITHRLTTRPASIPHVDVTRDVVLELWDRLADDRRRLRELVPGLGEWDAP
jgi:hypothetical protein